MIVKEKELAREILAETRVRAVQVDEKECPWADDYRPHWRVTVIYKGRKRTFDFWNNLENKQPSKELLLDCLLGDALAYKDALNIDEFSAEFGYTKVSEAIRSYNACYMTYRKLSTLFQVPDDVLYEMANIVRELA